jgi:chromosome partitioning protein
MSASGLGWPPSQADTSTGSSTASSTDAVGRATALGWPSLVREPAGDDVIDLTEPVLVIDDQAADRSAGQDAVPAAGGPRQGEVVEEPAAPEPVASESVAAGLRAELERLLVDGEPADDHPGDDQAEDELIHPDVDPDAVAAAIASAPIARARAALNDEPAPLEDDTPIGEIAAAAVRALNPGGRFDFPRPPHRRIITVANQKGGVGKTTTTVNLAAALALHGARVLVVDLDPQGNASTGLGVEHHSGVAGVYDVLIDGVPLAEVVQPAAGVPDLWCVPATIDLAGAEIELVSVVAREGRLKRAVDAFLAQPGVEIDYVIIDCPPSLGLLTVNAMVATEELLIPIQCEYYALEGLGQLLRNVELVRGHLNPALHVSTILLTMYDARTKLADQVREEVRQHFGPTVLSTTIPRSVRVSEAPGYGQSVVTYDPGSRGALAYLDAAREIAERGAAPADPPVETGDRSP